MTLLFEEQPSPNYGVAHLSFNRSFTQFATANAAGSGSFDLWDNVSRTRISTGPWPSADGVGTFVYNDNGTVWCSTVTGLTQVCTINSTFTASSARVHLPSPGADIYYCGGKGCITAATGHTNAQLYNGSTVAVVNVGFSPLSYLELGGIPWALGRSGTNILLRQIGGANTALTIVNPFGSTSDPFGLSNSAGNLVLFQGGHMAVVDTTGVVLHTAAIDSAYDRQTIVNHDGSDSLWIANFKYSLIDGSLQNSVTFTDWYANASAFGYDPLNDALFGPYLLGQSNINWLFFGVPGGGTGTGGGVTGETSIRCWGFTLDGHPLYVLRLGNDETLVFDRLTRQWSHWQSPGTINWRAHVGTNWQGMTGTLADGGTDIVAGDDSSGVLWRLDPNKQRDDLPTTGDAAFDRIVTGSVPLSGREAVQCGAFELTLALGNPAIAGASITLETSDDLGQSWTGHGSVTTTASDFTQVVEWRALGLMRQPGRLFRITDDGATVRIGRAQIR